MTAITVEVVVKKNIKEVWGNWTGPESIMQWNRASEDWCCPKAVNNLAVGGAFSYTMAEKDGMARFDFAGIYTKIEPYQSIFYTIGDGRNVEVYFRQLDDGTTKITETFDAEKTHTIEQQRDGWSAILQSFKRYSEAGADIPKAP